MIELLRRMIATPSVTFEEGAVADIVQEYLETHGADVTRIGNNLVCRQSCSKEGAPIVMLNSHIDTVKPAAGYTRNPYSPDIENGRLYGLGSNDAGGCVVSLIDTFLYFKDKELPFNLILVISAEEERSGENGFRRVLPELGRVDMGIVGEPTQLRGAVGEHGLVVLDCEAKGKSGHAARKEGVNALYIAMDDIQLLRGFSFDKMSEVLGPVNINVTQIEAGTQHNVIPDRCRFVVDIRTTDAYSNIETVEILRSVMKSEIKPRSTRLSASALPEGHPLVTVLRNLGIGTFNSPTTSDMALMPFPTLKIGPGDSARSHTADEYIYVSEIEEGSAAYKRIITELSKIIWQTNFGTKGTLPII